MKCQKCQKKLQPEWNFCPHCQTQLPSKPVCPGCGEKIDSEWRACPFCGMALPDDAGREKTSNSLGMEFVWCPPGTFMMGSPKDEDDREIDETLHQVTLTRGFYIQTAAVTQGQWKTVTGENPAAFQKNGDNCPVENVSWDAVKDFISKLNLDTGEKYHLPTEAEWEYACRAGSTTRYCFGDDKDKLDKYAWYHKNSNGTTHPVGHKKPNAWGLYDMHGNVWEWCEDWYGDYPSGGVTDPTGPGGSLLRVLSSGGSGRVSRGGSWVNSPQGCRSASRYGDTKDSRFYDLGFRLVRAI